MSALDDQIDHLYQLPLAAFTGARNALAKTLTKHEGTQVKALEKPNLVPWAANQVYWKARSTFDRLMKSGDTLRAAQIAALEGRDADVRGASDAHRRAIRDAVGEAERLAAATGAKPGADALARTFESLSLATNPPTPGRLTQPLQPAGFEALTGANLESKTQNPELKTQPAALALKKGNANRPTPSDERRSPNDERLARAAAKAAEAAAAKEAAERRKHEAALKDAEAAVARADAAEGQARALWERAHDELLAARQALSDLRRSRFRSS